MGKKQPLEAAPCSTGPRVLTLDIETAPLESYTWGIWDQNIGLNQIKSEWTILSFSAKWLGEKKVIYGDTGGNGPGLVRNDRGQEAFWLHQQQAGMDV
jgi:hypothetical protein